MNLSLSGFQRGLILLFPEHRSPKHAAPSFRDLEDQSFARSQQAADWQQEQRLFATLENGEYTVSAMKGRDILD